MSICQKIQFGDIFDMIKKTFKLCHQVKSMFL